jgi:hypothetical protein
MNAQPFSEIGKQKKKLALLSLPAGEKGSAESELHPQRINLWKIKMMIQNKCLK